MNVWIIDWLNELRNEGMNKCVEKFINYLRNE